MTCQTPEMLFFMICDSFLVAIFKQTKKHVSHIIWYENTKLEPKFLRSRRASWFKQQI